MKIYLAGGMRNGWRDIVKHAVPGVDFLDPATHGLSDEVDYTMWDLNAIRACDILFGFMEPDNPSGVGLANEIGFAYANEKYIIFVDQSPPDRTQYFGMCRAESDKVFTSLQDGIAQIHKVIALNANYEVITWE